jgi:hypothetical protein
MSVPAFRSPIPLDSAPSLPSLKDLRDTPARDRQATLHELRRRGNLLVAALDELRREARLGGKDLESTLRDLRREERDLAESVRKEIEDPRRGTLDAAQRQFLEEAVRVDQSVLQAYVDCRQELEVLRRRRLDEYASEWVSYLESLKEKPEYAALAPRVEEFWTWISKDLWAPEATPTDDGFLLTWDRDEHHLQVELFRDGTYDWFYRNRDTDVVSYEEGLPYGDWTAPFESVISALKGS